MNWSTQEKVDLRRSGYVPVLIDNEDFYIMIETWSHEIVISKKCDRYVVEFTDFRNNNELSRYEYKKFNLMKKRWIRY